MPSSDASPISEPAESAAPVVPPEVHLPEITVKGFLLSILLAAVLAAANAYLGLFAGMTVSASIPAAVASMAILRLFRQSNILENNIVQTAASSGEALAAGVIFTIPALLLIGYWPGFDYWQTAAIALVGGLLGVLFTIPLRRALIIQARLRFPEGLATAEVLKVGAAAAGAGPRGAGEAAAGLKTLLSAAGLGGLVKVGESGLGLWSEAVEGATRLGGAAVYAGMNLSPALLAVGFILGLPIAVVVFLGGAAGWLILMPVYGLAIGIPGDLTAQAAAKWLWSNHIRYVGIGAMLVGGLWTLVQLRAPIVESLRTLMSAYRGSGSAAGAPPPRTEQDASLPWILLLLVLSLLPMALLYRHMVGDTVAALGLTFLMAVAAFLFSSVAAYMAGLVGSSSNPVSGVTIATIMLAGTLLVLVMGRGHPAGPAATLVIGAVVCCAAAMGGDNLQDLKTGHVVGATPWKQQVMQVVGVATAAVVIVPVLALLQARYGIGEATAAHPHPLSAPQATLMASLARGMFGDGLPWPLVGLGAALGVGVVWFDRRQERRGATLRTPVLAVALGIYLPLTLSAAILLGGVIAELARRQRGAAPPHPRPLPRGGREEMVGGRQSGGLLFAAGLVTGEAVMGIVLALPVALSSIWPGLGSDPLRIFASPPLGPWPGVAAVAIVAWLLFRAATARR